MNLPPVFYPSENLTVQNLEQRLLELIQDLKSLIPEKQNVKKIILTVEMKIKELLKRFKEQSEHSFQTLAKEKSKLEIILLFLAILHLIRDRVATVEQTGQFSDIIVRTHLNNNP